MKTKQNKVSIRTSQVSQEKNPLQKIAIITRMFLSLTRESTMEEKVLAYLIQYSNGNIYHCRKGCTQLLCDRLSISKGTYNVAISKLIALQAIKKISNSDGSKYIFYRINGNMVNSCLKASELTISL